MGAIDRFLRRGRRGDDYKPMIKRLEAAMLAAVRAAGGSAWYVPDDFLLLGPELVVNGKFDGGLTGWVNTNAVASVVSDQGGNVLSLSQAGGSANLGQAISLDTSKAYQISFKRRGVALGSGLSGRLSFLYSDGSSAQSPTAAVTVRGDYELVTDVIIPIRPISTVRLIATTSSADNVGTVYFDDVSIREVLSVKDYQDSSGTVPAYIGGTVGLLFDAGSSTGAELIANPDTSSSWLAEGTTPPTAVNGTDAYLGKTCRSVTFPAIASGGYAVCRARDAENMFNVVAGTTFTAGFEYALSRDLTAGESISIAVTGSSGIYSKNLSAGAPGGIWASGRGTQPALVSGGGTSLRPYATVLFSPLTVYVRSVSVKVAGGVVASQATAGNRPVITRIPRKLGPELIVNGDFSNGTVGWTTIGAVSDASDGACTVTVSTTSGRVERGLVLEAGKTYVASANVSAASTIKSYLQVLRNAAGSYASIKYSSTVEAGQAMLNSAVFTAPATDALIQVANNSGTISGSFKVDNISVREVLEWSYALSFDGTNDSLATPASVIGATLTQPYTMIQAFRVGQINNGQRIQGDTGRLAGVGSTNKLVASHAGGASIVGATDVALGDIVVQEVVWDGTTGKIYRNGVLDATAAMAAPTGVTPAAHNVGQNGSASAYFKGDLVFSAVFPAVMTDAQRAPARKFAAALMGLSL